MDSQPSTSQGNKRKGQTSINQYFSKRSSSTVSVLENSSQNGNSELIPTLIPGTELDPSPSNSSTDETNQFQSVQDIEYFAGKSSLTSCEKYKVLTGLWTPSSGFIYPKKKCGSNMRSFQGAWLKDFNWLCYSKKLDAGFCKICVAFSGESVGKGNHQSKSAIATIGYSGWKDARETFNSHQKLSYHLSAAYFSDQFKSVYSQNSDSIATKLQSHLASEIEANRKAISSIIETIIFCGRQNIALRGHIDHGRVEPDSPDFNDGNFRSLLRFRISAGDSGLAHHFKSSPSNSMYTSAQIQNQLIQNCGSVILENIVRRINNAKCFAVLADETTDISTVEQLVICARYVHKENESFTLREDFLTFVSVTDLTGKGLADSILQNLDKLGIDLDHLRGQSYDRAAAMSSKLKGVQGRILEKYPKALYTYCASHCLNLVISDASSIQPIRNMVGTIKEV